MPSDTRQKELQGDNSKTQDVSDEVSGHRKRSRDGEDHVDESLSTSSPDNYAKKPRAGTREEGRTKISQESKEATESSVPIAMSTVAPTTCCAESTTPVPVVVPTSALAKMQEPALPAVLEGSGDQQDSALATEPSKISPLPINSVATDAVTSTTSDNVSESRDQLSAPAEASVPAVSTATPAQESTENSQKPDKESTTDSALEAEQSANVEQSTEAEQRKDNQQSVIEKGASQSNDNTHEKQDLKDKQSTPASSDTSTTQPTQPPQSVPNKSGPSLGFGAFAARSTPFQTASNHAKESSPHTPSASSDWAHTEAEPATRDAEDIVVRKKSVRKPDTDLPTGEEEEQTMAMIRAKLFAMTSDHTWKERGTGLLKINTRSSKATSRRSARLVMRSDAVLKVILNVQIFAGMQCHVEQERFLRFVAMEEEGLMHFAVKFANANDAHTFLEQLQEHIPASSSSDSS